MGCTVGCKGPTNSVLKESSALIIIPEFKKALIFIHKEITYACTVDMTKCRFHWTSVWLHLFIFHSLGSTNKLQPIQEEQCHIVQIPVKSRQGFLACRKNSWPVIETLEQCNTKLLVFNTWPTTVDCSVWLAGNSAPTPLGQLFPTDREQLGKGLGSSCEGSQAAHERLQKESALRGCAEPPARAGSRPVPVWRNKAAKK